MKRASYAIPLAGISLAACGDPIIATWDATLYDTTILPSTVTRPNLDGVLCEYTFSYQMEIAADLSLTFFTIEKSVCADGTVTDNSEALVGNVVVVDKKVKYEINLSEGNGDVTVLTCNLVGADVLNCLYGDLPFNFALAEE